MNLAAPRSSITGIKLGDRGALVADVELDRGRRRLLVAEVEFGRGGDRSELEVVGLDHYGAVIVEGKDHSQAPPGDR